MARPAGLEPATLGLEGRCSIQLSYGRVASGDFLADPRLGANDETSGKGEMVGAARLALSLAQRAQMVRIQLR